MFLIQLKITSDNGIIKNDNVLDVSKSGIFQVNYEIINPNSRQIAQITSERESKLYNGYGYLAVFSGRILSKNSK